MDIGDFYVIFMVEAATRGLARISIYFRGQSFMRGWRSKFILLLIVYFAGIATAIYVLSPVPEDNTAASLSEQRDFGFVHSFAKSDQFAKSFNAGMHKCVDFVKDLSRRTGVFVKEKIDERQADS